MKNTQTIIAVIILILLGAAGFYFIKNNKPADNITTTPPLADTSVKHFTDANNTFTFDYNPLFTVVEGDSTTLTTDWQVNTQEKGFLLARVTVPQSYMPGTNFSEAFLTVGRAADMQSCLTEDGSNSASGTPVTFAGFPFKKFTYRDAGAGNFYVTTSYKGVVAGDYCYVVEYTIHSTNIGNYPPDQGIKEFDRAKIQNELEKIIRSFKFFTNNTD